MDSETLQEKKPEEEAPMQEVQPEEVKEEEPKEEPKQVGNPPQLSEKDVSRGSDEKVVEESKEEEPEVGEEAEASKISIRKRDRKGNLKKKPSQDSVEAKPSQELPEKKEKEPVTPASDRPTRERKVVERYSAPSVARSSATKPLSIEKGRGTQLKDIPNVAFKLSKRKPNDNLQILHTILFGKKAKAHSLKRNIGQFSGFVWVENEQEKQKAKVREKLDKCVKEKLMEFCDVLNVPINKAAVKKEELSLKLLEFLESPHATTDILLADKEQKGKKRKVTSGDKVSSGEASDTPAKKRRTSQAGEKQKHSSNVEEEEEDDDDDRVDSPDAKVDSDDDNDNDTTTKEESDHDETKSEEEEDEHEEQMSGKKGSSRMNDLGHETKDKSTSGKKKVSSAKSVKTSVKSTKKSPGSSLKQDGSASGGTSKSKSSSSKKQKVQKESSKEQSVSNKDKATGKKQSKKSPTKVLTKDQGKGKTNKKAKAEPSIEEMHAVVVDILKKVDFNTATLSDILRQLGTHFGVDLMHRKAEVKDIITDVINSMSDEEDEGEEPEDDAEDNGNGDADKDGDGNDDDDDDDDDA
ncbi:DEK_C domain-containing protein [Cephalotus follicularis]|uniref:DEK_C domain-containing protein n=1 Tax=Cephalotus follicularis TaxID=3775 RepID=A0A1Q3CNE4_CEPFO|nr:DEK_C domain-containing protein [Cephalotus follicularis]